MRNIYRIIFSFSLFFYGALPLGAEETRPAVSAGPAYRSAHVTAALVPEVTSIQPGTGFWIALHLTMDEHWHTYWENPGDAGLPTVVEWKLPAGFSAGPLRYPYPEKFQALGVVNFGYEGEVYLLTEITSNNLLELGKSVTLAAHVRWLECAEICIPIEADLELNLPVTAGLSFASPDRAKIFSKARAKLPLPDAEWKLTATYTNEDIIIKLVSPGSVTYASIANDLVFFPLEQDIIDPEAAQTLKDTPEGYELYLKRSKFLESPPGQLRGVLVSSSGWRGPGSERALQVDVVLEKALVTSGLAASTEGGMHAALAMLFAFLGGLLLNLMPCVLPVLSIKILGFVAEAGASPAKARLHGWLFSLGVLVSFWALAAALVILRAAGHQIGWGFQLQSPAMVVFLAAIFFLFALNLFGWFEIGLIFTRFGARSDRSAPYWKSFSSGVLATVVATPCTAPFMGVALGFGLTQPLWIAFSIFTALGLGMAAPYVLLSSSPGLLRFVPKPGPWMITLKRVLALFMLATVVWLAWVLSLQSGLLAVRNFCISLAPLALGAWLTGRIAEGSASPRRRVEIEILAMLLIAGGVIWAIISAEPEKGLKNIDHAQRANQAATEGIAWEPYTQARFKELLAEGKPVFIDFTAAWCLSCQVNERVVFSSREVREKFRALGITALKADWTRQDPEVTAALASYGRSSVPLYVFYPAGAESKPVLLPEIITPGIVLDALDKA